MPVPEYYQDFPTEKEVNAYLYEVYHTSGLFDYSMGTTLQKAHQQSKCHKFMTKCSNSATASHADSDSVAVSKMPNRLDPDPDMAA